MNTQYLSVPVAELKEVIFQEEALVSFLTKDLETPPCIHMNTTSTQFKQFTFTYVYNVVIQSWFYVLLLCERYNLALIYNTHFGTQTIETPLQVSKEITSPIVSWDEEYKPLNKLYKAH